MEWEGLGTAVEETEWVYEVKVSSSAGHPVLLAEESASHVRVFQDRQMLVLHDGCQFKVN